MTDSSEIDRQAEIVEKMTQFYSKNKVELGAIQEEEQSLDTPYDTELVDYDDIQKQVDCIVEASAAPHIEGVEASSAPQYDSVEASSAPLQWKGETVRKEKAEQTEAEQEACAIIKELTLARRIWSYKPVKGQQGIRDVRFWNDIADGLTFRAAKQRLVGRRRWKRQLKETELSNLNKRMNVWLTSRELSFVQSQTRDVTSQHYQTKYKGFRPTAEDEEIRNELNIPQVKRRPQQHRRRGDKIGQERRKREKRIAEGTPRHVRPRMEPMSWRQRERAPLDMFTHDMTDPAAGSDPVEASSAPDQPVEASSAPGMKGGPVETDAMRRQEEIREQKIYQFSPNVYEESQTSKMDKVHRNYVSVIFVDSTDCRRVVIACRPKIKHELTDGEPIWEFPYWSIHAQERITRGLNEFEWAQMMCEQHLGYSIRSELGWQRQIDTCVYFILPVEPIEFNHQVEANKPLPHKYRDFYWTNPYDPEIAYNDQQLTAWHAIRKGHLAELRDRMMINIMYHPENESQYQWWTDRDGHWKKTYYKPDEYHGNDDEYRPDGRRKDGWFSTYGSQASEAKAIEQKRQPRGQDWKRRRQNDGTEVRTQKFRRITDLVGASTAPILQVPSKIQKPKVVFGVKPVERKNPRLKLQQLPAVNPVEAPSAPGIYPVEAPTASGNYMVTPVNAQFEASVLANIDEKIGATDVIIDTGAGLPTVSAQRLSWLEAVTGQTCRRSKSSVTIRDAGCGLNHAICDVHFNINLSLRKDQTFQTSFSVICTGQDKSRATPFLMSSTQMDHLDLIIDYAGPHMISRKTGYAYLLRKIAPGNHIVFDMINNPMKKLDTIPKQVRFTNWQSPYKDSRAAQSFH